MRTYEVRNKRTGMVLGEVRVEQPDEVLNEWMRESGMTLEDVFKALGGSMEAVREALDICEVVARQATPDERAATRPLSKPLPARRGLFCDA